MSARVSNRFETNTAKNAVPLSGTLGCSGIAVPRTLAFVQFRCVRTPLFERQGVAQKTETSI
jgi:hypothetical protein